MCLLIAYCWRNNHLQKVAANGSYNSHRSLKVWRKKLRRGKIESLHINLSFSLDEILVGGLMSGMFYEICGLSAAGKTQLCTTIAVNLAQIHKIGTLYVDCKGDLSGKRIHQMLTAQKRSIKDTRQTMDLIRRQQCDDADQLVDLLKELLGNIEQFEGTHRLLVVDSMPALWYLLLGDESSASTKIFYRNYLPSCINANFQV